MSNQITTNPSVPSQVVQEVKFPKFVNNLGIIPTSYKDSMSYYECLAWLCKYLEETVIPTVNENGEAVEELQNLYVELNSYVTHYFDNLDVQEEINNKLDDMVEAGTLQEIIATYLNSKAVFGFDTVAEMKNATNLINGSYAKTLGFYEINDGGASLYKIRTIETEDVIDEMFKISISELLLAELIPINNTVSTIQVGIVGDNETDVTSKMQILFASNYNILIKNGIYIVNDELTINNNKSVNGEKGNLIIAKENMVINKAIIVINSNDVSLNNLNISGNIQENPIGDIYNKDHGISLIDIIDSSKILIQNCKLFDNAYCAIRIRTIENESNIENYRFTNNNFSNVDCCIISISASGIEFNLKDFIISNNIFNGHQYSEPVAFFQYGTTTDVIISNNIFKNKTGANSILFNHTTGYNVNISDNIIHDMATGINLTDVHNFNINNNIIKGIQSNLYQALYLTNCSHGEINNNTSEKIIYSGFRIENCSYLNINNNSFYNTNINSDGDKEAIYIKNCSYINAHENYAKQNSNTFLYNLIGDCSYIDINENNNLSQIFFGFAMNGLTSLTNSKILTNLNIRSNFNASALSSSTNIIKQNYTTVVDGITLAGGYRFAREVSLKNTSARTLSTFTIYNIIDYDVYTLNIYPTANLTLTSDSSSDFGITWKSDRTINSPTSIKLMYYNNKLYEL